MHSQEWSGTRITAALAALSDAGIPQSRMARMAGVNRSQVNRWSRGENRPGYDPVRKLALAVWRSHPGIARELVEASGYAWAEPGSVPEPPPIPSEVLAAIKKNYPPDQQDEVIAMLRELTAPPSAGESEPPAGTSRAG